MMQAAVCLGCVETCKSCAAFLGCDFDRNVVGHNAKLLSMAEALPHAEVALVADQRMSSLSTL